VPTRNVVDSSTPKIHFPVQNSKLVPVKVDPK
jgi:hypothetical protein